jgi:hypothetical protein
MCIVTDEAAEGVMSESTPLSEPGEAPQDDVFAPPPRRAGAARDDSALLAPAEWYLLVARRREDGTFLLVRRPESAAPTLLSTAPPHADEGLLAGLVSVLRTHLRVQLVSDPYVSPRRRPARMAHPYTGGPAVGILRAVAVDVTGAPEVDALFESFEALSAEEAEAALATDLERAIFRDGVALLD